MFPIKPGTPASLTGNMGELRAGHFHGGIDIRTGWALRWPVLASADGYVSRVKVSSAGYGNVIHVRHPNGYSTVYAHLEVFGGGVADYVRQNQYHNQSFEIDLFPDSGMFAVARGQVIGLSGNSGGSGGPHLHFEIRDTADAMLNPLSFGFREVSDRLKPYFKQVALRTLSQESRVDEQFGRLEYVSKPIGNGKFGLSKTITGWGDLALDVIALDRINNGSSRAGISCLEVYLDDNLIHYYNFDRILDAQTGHINSYIDFEQYQQSGQKFLRCHIAEGNPLKTRRSQAMQGRIPIYEQKKYKLRVVIADAYHNTSVLHIEIEGKKPIPFQIPVAEIATFKLAKPILKKKVFENILKLSIALPASKTSDSLMAYLYFNGKIEKKNAAYFRPKEIVFLHDLRRGLPDSLRFGQYGYAFHFSKIIAPQPSPLVWIEQYLGLKIPESSLLDTLFAHIEYDTSAGKNHFTINSPEVTLINPLQISFKPLVFPARTDKLFVCRKLIFSNKLKFVGGRWKDNTISFAARTLGSFCLATDSTPPRIKPVVVNKSNISIQIFDNLSGIQSFRASLNGSWLLMNYDHKRNLIWAEPLETKPMLGFFEIQVSDQAGNTSVLKRQIK